MWNKLLLVLFVASLTFSLAAQQSRRSRSRSRNRSNLNLSETVQPKKKSEKKTAEQPTAAKSDRPDARKNKFDPKKTIMTQSQVDYVMNSLIRKKLLECKISAKLPGHKDDDEDTSENKEKSDKFAFVSGQDFSKLMSRYKMMTANFELTEVTGIRPEWYQQYQNELNKFIPIINEMTIAIRAHSSERYAAGLHKFKEHQKACLKFLKEKPPRITKEQYQALWQKNTQTRQQNYLKQLRDEREAAMKRRQEQLRQLQQKNQPKNQGNQKTKQGTSR